MRGIPVTASLALAFMCVLSGTRLGATEMAFQILHEFVSASGPRFPYGPLIEGQDGNFYGTSRSGGSAAGTIFKITPQGTPTVLHTFDRGQFDFFNMVETSNGDLYGLADVDLQGHLGKMLFRFRPNDLSFSVVATYDTWADYPSGLLTSDGTNFYGVGFQGGAESLGSVFRVTTNGSFTVIFSFSGTNGAYPLGQLLKRGDGMLYGTALGGNGFDGGWSGRGTVFKVTTNGIHTTLTSFALTNGSAPFGSLRWGHDGQIYGTTVWGGAAGGTGTVFRISTDGLLTTVATFYGTNGLQPMSGVTQAPNGKFYGVTAMGFTNSYWGEVGSVFSVTTNGVLTTMAKFDGTNAVNPLAELILARDGNLYGVTTDVQLHTTLNSNSGLFFRLAQVPEITATILTNGVTWLQWTSFTNGVYRVEGKDALTNSNWTPLSSNLTATGNNLSFASSTAGVNQRYYRVVLLP